jgi:hypothetical protein
MAESAPSVVSPFSFVGNWAARRKLSTNERTSAGVVSGRSSIDDPFSVLRIDCWTAFFPSTARDHSNLRNEKYSITLGTTSSSACRINGASELPSVMTMILSPANVSRRRSSGCHRDERGVLVQVAAVDEVSDGRAHSWI